MPPSLISVPRPSTTVVEKPFEVTTRTVKSTGRRFHRRVESKFGIAPIMVSTVNFFKLPRGNRHLASSTPWHTQIAGLVMLTFGGGPGFMNDKGAKLDQWPIAPDSFVTPPCLRGEIRRYRLRDLR